MARIYVVFIFFLLIAGSIGCRSAAYYWRTVEVTAKTTEETNRGMPVAVDLVVAYEKAFADTLASMPAEEWFDRRSDLEMQYANSFERDGWEWAPGQRIPTQRLAVRYGAEAAYIFANYQSPGVHRVEVPPYTSVQLILRRNDVVVQPR